MIQKQADATYTSSLLTTLGIKHAYSSRTFGDMRDESDKRSFLQTLQIKSDDVVIGEQVHRIRVMRVTASDKGNTLAGIDGLVTTGSVCLGVTFADCVPLLAADAKAKVIGTAHAGWKGTIAGIAGELILTMQKAGADSENIYVSIGPHIGMCCYNVREERALSFQQQFGGNEKIAARILGAWHVDIGYANYEQLLSSGITKDHIDAPILCTSCQVNEFNSFRKDPKEKFGVQLGVITL